MNPKEKESYYQMTREYFKKCKETYEKKYEPEKSIISVDLPIEIVAGIDEELKTRPGMSRSAWIMEAAINYRNRDKE
jgi:hypothetical protein